jgi:uroporphyrinogen decarboxylase
MPEYQAIRSKYSFLELCKTPAVAAEVTVMTAEKLEVDAAIIFADILLLIEPLGRGLKFIASGGPVIERPIRAPEHVEALLSFDVKDALAYVFEAVQLSRKALPTQIPLIGFAGAPFTLASYLIEGGSSRDFIQTKRFMYNHRQAWHMLLEKLADATISYLTGQIEAGAAVIQLFDSWVGCLSPDDYRQFVLPHSQKVLSAIQHLVPTIHFGLAGSNLLPLIKEAGGSVIGLDWRVELDAAWRDLGVDVGVQGNLDPVVLMVGDHAEIENRAAAILQKADGRPGHIFNLGHGVLPGTPVDNVRFLIEAVHRLSAR